MMLELLTNIILSQYFYKHCPSATKYIYALQKAKNIPINIFYKSTCILNHALGIRGQMKL